jgi:hypothetical protein
VLHLEPWRLCSAPFRPGAGAGASYPHTRIRSPSLRTAHHHRRDDAEDYAQTVCSASPCVIARSHIVKAAARPRFQRPSSVSVPLVCLHRPALSRSPSLSCIAVPTGSLSLPAVPQSLRTRDPATLFVIQDVTSTVPSHTHSRDQGDFAASSNHSSTARRPTSQPAPSQWHNSSRMASL